MNDDEAAEYQAALAQKHLVEIEAVPDERTVILEVWVLMQTGMAMSRALLAIHHDLRALLECLKKT